MMEVVGFSPSRNSSDIQSDTHFPHDLWGSGQGQCLRQRPAPVNHVALGSTKSDVRTDYGKLRQRCERKMRRLVKDLRHVGFATVGYVRWVGSCEQGAKCAPWIGFILQSLPFFEIGDEKIRWSHVRRFRCSGIKQFAVNARGLAMFL